MNVMIFSSELRQHDVKFSSELKPKILHDTYDEISTGSSESLNVSPSSLLKTRFEYTIPSNAKLFPSSPTQLCSTCCNGGLVGSLPWPSLVIIENWLPVSCKNINSFPEMFTFKNNLFECLTCCTAAQTFNDAVLYSALFSLQKGATIAFFFTFKTCF